MCGEEKWAVRKTNCGPYDQTLVAGLTVFSCYGEKKKKLVAVSMSDHSRFPKLSMFGLGPAWICHACAVEHYMPCPHQIIFLWTSLE